ncbi:MAG: MFS transporter [bacterium]|nr:MFS transporter [bacterium]
MSRVFKRIFSFNKIVRIFVVIDFFFNSAFGLFAPVFAIFILDQIVGGSAKVAGLAAASYWVTKSVFQLPIANFLDKTDGERDDFWALFFGYLLSSLVPLLYILAREPVHLYLIQAFLGFCMAWAVPAWYGIFTRHLDSGHISFEWSLQSVFSVGIATSAATAIGGYVADIWGFEILFIAASILIFVSALLLLLVRKDMKPLQPSTKIVPERPSHHL